MEVVNGNGILTLREARRVEQDPDSLRARLDIARSEREVTERDIELTGRAGRPLLGRPCLAPPLASLPCHARNAGRSPALTK